MGGLFRASRTSFLRAAGEGGQDSRPYSEPGASSGLRVAPRAIFVRRSLSSRSGRMNLSVSVRERVGPVRLARRRAALPDGVAVPIVRVAVSLIGGRRRRRWGTGARSHGGGADRPRVSRCGRHGRGGWGRGRIGRWGDRRVGSGTGGGGRCIGRGGAGARGCGRLLGRRNRLRTVGVGGGRRCRRRIGRRA